MARLGAAEWEAMGSVKLVREMHPRRATRPVVPPVPTDSGKKEAGSEKSSAAVSEAPTALHTAAGSSSASADASTAASAHGSRQISPRRLEELRQALNQVVPARPGTMGLEQELQGVLQKWDLEDAADTLATNGYKSLRRLKRMLNEDVDELGLPRGTAKELKALLEALRTDDSPAAAGLTYVGLDDLVSALMLAAPRDVLALLYVDACR